MAPKDFSYVSSGYAPLSVRLVQHAVTGKGWAAIHASTLAQLPKPALEFTQTDAPAHLNVKDAGQLPQVPHAATCPHLCSVADVRPWSSECTSTVVRGSHGTGRWIGDCGGGRRAETSDFWGHGHAVAAGRGVAQRIQKGPCGVLRRVRFLHGDCGPSFPLREPRLYVHKLLLSIQGAFFASIQSASNSLLARSPAPF